MFLLNSSAVFRGRRVFRDSTNNNFVAPWAITRDNNSNRKPFKQQFTGSGTNNGTGDETSAML
jgi:hypothetical protein